MGQAKKKQLEEENRGYDEYQNRFVCSSHFEDDFIKNFITEKSIAKQCNYCSNNEKVIKLADLMEFLNEKIETYYGDIKDQCLPWANSWLDKDDYTNFPYHNSCGFLVPNKRAAYNIDELFTKIKLQIDDKNLYTDIKNYFKETTIYCLINAFYDTEEEELFDKWKRFSKIVKHTRRYTFFKMSEFTENQHSENGLGDILSELREAVMNENLITTINPDAPIYRCRVDSKDKIFTTIDELASPPDKCASQNRMSPAGISMFYGACEPKTAIKEVSNTVKNENNITIGYFKIIKPIKVIDFTGSFNLSIFGDYDYNVMSFLKSFALQIAKPISEKDRKIEYVPTQIITEYFRYVFKTRNNENINGLKYRSAEDKGGFCYVLFFDQKNCREYLSLYQYGILKTKDEMSKSIDWIDTTT